MVGFCAPVPHGCKSLRKQSITQNLRIEGRHFVDMFLLAQFYDVGMRPYPDLSAPTLHGIIGFVTVEELSALNRQELQRAYIDNDERFRERALCAVRETRAVADLLSPSYFIQAQIFPYNYRT